MRSIIIGLALVLAGCATPTTQSHDTPRYGIGDCFRYAASGNSEKVGQVLYLSGTQYYVEIQGPTSRDPQYADLIPISRLDASAVPAPCPARAAGPPSGPTHAPASAAAPSQPSADGLR